MYRMRSMLWQHGGSRWQMINRTMTVLWCWVLEIRTTCNSCMLDLSLPSHSCGVDECKRHAANALSPDAALLTCLPRVSVRLHRLSSQRATWLAKRLQPLCPNSCCTLYATRADTLRGAHLCPSAGT